MAKFSPDGKRLLTADEHFARVWDAVRYEPVTPPLEHPRRLGEGQITVYSIDNAFWMRDGIRVVTAGTAEVRIWDATSGKLLLKIGTGARVRVAYPSPDGKLLVTSNGSDGAAIWDTSNARLLRVLLERGELTDAVFSQDSSEIVTCNGKTCRVRNPLTGSDLVPPITGRQVWGRPDISPDGTLLALGSQGHFQIVNVRGGKSITATPSAELRDVNSATDLLRFTPDGSAVIWGALAGVEAFNSRTGQSLSGDIIPVPLLLAFLDCSPDSETIALGGNKSEAGIWDLKTAKRIQPLSGGSDVHCVGYSPDGKRVAAGTAGADSFTNVWAVVPTHSKSKTTTAEPK